MFHKILLQGFILLLAFGTCNSQSDTTKLLKNYYRIKSLSSYSAAFNLSFIYQSTGSTKKTSFVSIGDLISYAYTNDTSKLPHFISIYHELTFNKFTDSVWIKSFDNLNFIYNLMPVKDKNVNHTFNFELQTPLFADYTYMRDETGKMKKIKSAGFFNPGSLLLGYGYTFKFFKKSRFQLSIASLKLRTIPAYDTAYYNSPLYKNDLKGKHSIIKVDYGLDAQLYIQEKIHDKLTWMNRSTMFISGIGKSQVNFSILNSFQFQILKWLGFTVKTNVLYRPSNILKQVKFRQEVGLGLQLTSY